LASHSIGSSKGTHDALTEASAVTDVWNVLTLTDEYNGSSWGAPTPGDLDYGSYWIEGTTMHFKYDINSDHITSIDAQGDLIKQ
jgi:hypothetical protein